MGRSGQAGSGGSARVFVRPVAMLALGALAGLVMWRVLMADDGRGGSFQRRVAAGSPILGTLRDARPPER
jgi:hypothetical protein